MRTIPTLLCFVALSACSRPLGLSPLPTSIDVVRHPARPAAAHYTLLYSFQGAGDGQGPAANLAALGGTLYGTTVYGGSGNGTVFSITTSGKERVLYAFKGSPDGALPGAGLIVVNGALFGTTEGGGAHGYGTVFKITTTGKETILYSFKGFRDGATPVAALLQTNRMLYGTTLRGGAGGSYGNAGGGVLFAVSASGNESVVHRFGNGNDGSAPVGALIAIHGVLYGATSAGGKSGYGTIFSMTRSGKERLLHAFTGGSAGAHPNGSLIFSNGVLYGTTNAATSSSGPTSLGTIFKVSASGKNYGIIHIFSGPPDGSNPNAGLTELNGSFYGTTNSGGTPVSNNQFGNGTIFGTSATGKERAIYRFKGTKYGADPQASLTRLGGTLYGTTQTGGAGGNGTVFALAP